MYIRIHIYIIHIYIIHYTYIHIHYTLYIYTLYIYTYIHYTYIHYTYIHYTYIHYTCIHYTYIHYTYIHYKYIFWQNTIGEVEKSLNDPTHFGRSGNMQMKLSHQHLRQIYMGRNGTSILRVFTSKMVEMMTQIWKMKICYLKLSQMTKIIISNLQKKNLITF